MYTVLPTSCILDWSLLTLISDTVMSLVTLLPTSKVYLKLKSTTCTALLKHSTYDSSTKYMPLGFTMLKR